MNENTIPLFLTNPPYSVYTKNPRYIIIEGIDGSGKTTLREAICKFLIERGKSPFKIQEPGTTSIGERVRAIVKTEEVHPRVAHLLFEAARLDTLMFIRELLKKADAVAVGDRHTDSSKCYQSAMGVEDSYIEKVQSTYSDLPRPDVTIYLDIEPEVAMERIRGRSSVDDNFDNQSLEFFQKVSWNYRNLFVSGRRNHYFIVNAAWDEDRVANHVISFLKVLFPL